MMGLPGNGFLLLAWVWLWFLVFLVFLFSSSAVEALTRCACRLEMVIYMYSSCQSNQSFDAKL